MATDEGMMESDEYQDWIDRYGEELPRNSRGSKQHIPQQPKERRCSQDHQALAIDRVRLCPECGVVTH